MRQIFLLTWILSGNLCAQEAIYCNSTKYRSWWDVQHYSIKTDLNPKSKKLKGETTISALVVSTPIDTLQVDLANTLKIKAVYFNGKKLKVIKGERAQLVIGEFSALEKGSTFNLDVIYKGKPVQAVKPPWDGGLVFAKDQNENPWMAVACQGDGASIWWPCKDDPRDEPNQGVDLFYAAPNHLMAIGNGRLIASTQHKKRTEWHWQTVNPINLYDVTFYIGDYVHWGDSIQGEKGNLTLDYYVLRDNLTKAKEQFGVVPEMLHCFEDWFGPYPFYEDGYKLVESPYLGMEHQSAIAYGNEYQMGYLGSDRSGTGVGKLFDFIIIHESGHEWFGNNISIDDVAYSWVHEGFTTYSEAIFAECHLGIEKSFKYQHGQWRNISNRTPMEGKTGDCDGGSSDHYAKGAAMIHMIRTIMQDDEKFKLMLRSMNETFYHSTVSGFDIESFINEYSGIDFSLLFDQYLRTENIPNLEFQKNDKGITQYRWTNCIEGFEMPLVIISGGEEMWIHATQNWQSLDSEFVKEGAIKVSDDFYVTSK